MRWRRSRRASPQIKSVQTNLPHKDDRITPYTCQEAIVEKDSDAQNAPADEDTHLNDSSDYQGCFACGARNASGLQLVFRREGDEIVTEYTPEPAFQGFPGVAHGGIIATLLDETLNRMAVMEKRWLMTARLEIRYRLAAPLDGSCGSQRAPSPHARAWFRLRARC